jgi:hypothetical protein
MGIFFLNYSIFNGHAPTEISDDKERDGFFDTLEKKLTTKAQDMI